MVERTVGRVLPGLEPRIGEKYRLVLEDNGVLRPLLWLQVAKDGSVYTGVRYPNLGTLRSFGALAPERQVRVRYAETEEVHGPGLGRDLKISYHRSGWIHKPGGRIKGYTLADLKRPVQLALIAFEPPDRYQPIQRLRRRSGERDIGVPYPVDHSKGLLAKLILAPIGSPLIRVSGWQRQMTLRLIFSGFTDGNGRELQIAFGDGPGGWPRYTLVAASVPARSGSPVSNA